MIIHHSLAPIFIATKGRSEECPTAKALAASEVPFYLVVEPQEEQAYLDNFPEARILVLPYNERGVTFARNFILAYARVEKYEWFWMLDDDIKQTYFVEEKKVVKAPICAVLLNAQQVIAAMDNVAVGAMEYQQYAWSASKPSVRNSYCDVAVLINVAKTAAVNYRPECKEDRDFVLQCLALGYDSARSTWTAFSVPKNGSNKGGLQEAYASGREVAWSKNMVSMWPGICEHHIKKDGRPDVKIHWKRLKQPIG